jgi:hypothetical protein
MLQYRCGDHPPPQPGWKEDEKPPTNPKPPEKPEDKPAIPAAA